MRVRSLPVSRRGHSGSGRAMHTTHALPSPFLPAFFSNHIHTHTSMGIAPSTGGLAEAAANGDVGALKQLISSGADVKAADKVRELGEGGVV